MKITRAFILGFLLAVIGGAVGAQTVVFQQAKFAATSTASDSIKTAGGITAAGVGIVGTNGKVPALTSTYINSLSFDAANLTNTIASARLSGSYTGITGVGTLTAGTWNGSPINGGSYVTSLVGAWDTSKTCDTGYGAATDLAVHVTVGTSGAASISSGGVTIPAGGNGVGGSGTMIVKKGETWSVNLLGGTCGTDVAIYVRAIGS